MSAVSTQGYWSSAIAGIGATEFSKNSGRSEWRLAMVVDALGTPDVRVYTLREFERAFDLAPLVWKGVRKAAV